METLLVLPVFIMLLGGLFVIGDLAHARIRGGILDRTAAWIRPYPYGTVPPDTTIAAHHRYWEGVNAGTFGWMGMKLGDPSDVSVSPVQSWGVRPEDTANAGSAANGVLTHGNSWCGFYQGVSFVSAGVPFWVPLLDVAQSIYAEKNNEPRSASVYRIHPDHPGWIAGADPQFGRKYVFTRRIKGLVHTLPAAMVDPPPERCATIEGLQEEHGGYQDIILDSWPCIGGLVEVVPLPVKEAYVRDLSAVVLAEQKSGLAQ